MGYSVLNKKHGDGSGMKQRSDEAEIPYGRTSYRELEFLEYDVNQMKDGKKW